MSTFALRPPPSLFPVADAFANFRRDHVDLEPTQVERAKSSQQFLIDRILDSTMFPAPTGYWLPSGSFARGTKLRPLDDLDLLLLFDGWGTELRSWPFGGYQLHVHPLNPLSTLAQNGFLNSTRLLFALRDHVQALPHYRRSDVRKDMHVVNVDLSSTPWAFDIAPAIPIRLESGDLVFAIPNGRAQWSLTDPRLDAARIDRCNAAHGGLLRPTIRLIKYWNRRTHKPVLGSYHLETLVLNLFDGAPPSLSVPDYLARFFANIEPHLMAACPDPKRLGPALDRDVNLATKARYRFAVRKTSQAVQRALALDRRGHSMAAKTTWRAVFGNEFPIYT